MKKESQKAIQFARKKKNKKEIAFKLLYEIESSSVPYSIFMAGAPGAGKTEFARQIMKDFPANTIVHIDGDDLRELLPGYTGNNSHLFQGAISNLVDYIHDCVLRNNISFLLDGTLAEESIAFQNLNRSLKRGRRVMIFFIIQDPLVSWKYTVAREKKEGRRIQKDVFIDRYVKSYRTVKKILEKYDKTVEVILVKKNYDTHKVDSIHVLRAGESNIDEYVEKIYNKNELHNML